MMNRLPLTVSFIFLVVFGAVAVRGETVGTVPDPGADVLFAGDTFRLDSVVCPFKGTIDYEPGEIECGLLQVPENREKPGSRSIELLVIKLNSTWDGEADDAEGGEETAPAPGKRNDPIIYLTGGPGAHATYYVKRFKDHGIRKHRDLYILEQRGIGNSDDFCPFYTSRKPEAGNALTFKDHLEAGLTAMEDCALNAAADGVDLSGYNTFENARDVKALRIALGFDDWNVWGISYGTILGQAYLKVDPEGIRAIVLDAIVPLDIHGNPWAWRSVQWYDRDLRKLDELCGAQPDCAARYPDLGERIRRATLSVRDDPILVEVKDTETFPSGRAAVFSDVVAFLPFAFMYEQSNYPGLPALIYTWADAVERRDEEVFKAIVTFSDSFFGDSRGMTDAILCNDGDTEVQALSGLRDLEEFPVLAGAIGTEESIRRKAELCSKLGMSPRDPAEYLPVETEIPALLIVGDMDPITPPPLARAILPGFSNGTLVVFPWAGHGPSRSVECAGDMLNLFFDDPDAEPALDCVDRMERPDFYAPLFTTNLGPRVATRMAENRKSLIIPGIWGGAVILISVIALLVLTFAPIGRRIDCRPAPPASGARVFAWMASFLVVVSAVVFGFAVSTTFKAFEALLLFGLVPWARWGAVAGVLAGVVGIVVVVLVLRAQSRKRLPIGTLLGFLVTGLAAVGFSVFLMWAGLGPF